MLSARCTRKLPCRSRDSSRIRGTSACKIASRRHSGACFSWCCNWMLASWLLPRRIRSTLSSGSVTVVASIPCFSGLVSASFLGACADLPSANGHDALSLVLGTTGLLLAGVAAVGWGKTRSRCGKSWAPGGSGCRDGCAVFSSLTSDSNRWKGLNASGVSGRKPSNPGPGGNSEAGIRRASSTGAHLSS